MVRIRKGRCCFGIGVGRGGVWRESVWDIGEIFSIDSVVSVNLVMEVKEGFLEEGLICFIKSWMVVIVILVYSF